MCVYLELDTCQYDKYHKYDKYVRVPRAGHVHSGDSSRVHTLPSVTLPSPITKTTIMMYAPSDGSAIPSNENTRKHVYCVGAVVRAVIGRDIQSARVADGSTVR